MVLLQKIIAILLFFIASANAYIFNIHMFQLNGYKSMEHIKWLQINKSKLIPQGICLIISVFMLIFSGNYSIFLFLVSFIAFIFAYKHGKQKKPLVYTNRVKRLIATILLIELVVAIIAIIISSPKFSVVLLGFAYVIIPLVVILANLINKPIEYAVNQHYINDAKRILKSAQRLTIIGVTGSYGKTSVKYYLNTLLRAKYNVLMTPESYNTPMGIVKTIRGDLRATHEIFICEMGARYLGEIKEICDIVHPNHGVITSIGPQHLETFKSISNIAKTKFELAESLPSTGMLFLNGDNELIITQNTNNNAVFYGLDESNSFCAFDLKINDKGTTFTVKSPSGETCSYTTKLIGKHNVVNILSAIAVCHGMGITLQELIPQVRKLECVPHRLQLSTYNGNIIIDDAYNSNPNGTKVALETLNYFDGTKIIVTPGMVELGDKQDEYNFQFGVDISKVCDYAILVGERQTNSIYNGLISASYPQDKIFVAKTIGEALNYAHSIISNDRKIILLENDLPDNY